MRSMLRLFNSALVMTAALLAVLVIPLGATGASAVGTFTLTGTVTDAATSAPLSDITVRLSSWETGYTAATSTDSSGHFSVPNVPADYVSVSFLDFAGLHGGAYAGVEAGATGTVVRNAQMLPGGAAQGTITDATTGAPIEGICINSASTQTCTNAAGQYRTAATTSTYLYLSFDVGDSGYIPPPFTTVSLTIGSVETRDFQLQPGATFVFDVTSSADGSPVESCLYYSSVSGPPMYAYRCDDDADGTITSPGMPAGSYRISVQPTDGKHLSTTYPSHDTAVELATLETKYLTQVVQLGGSISGVVTTPGGAPAVEACVYAVRSSMFGDFFGACTDETGAYSITGMVDGSYEVGFGISPYGTSGLFVGEYFDDAATADEATPVLVSVGVDTDGIDAELDIAGVITGTLTDSATGEPLGGICVTAQNEVNFQNACTDEDGFYEIAGLQPGSYSIEVYTDEYLGENYPTPVSAAANVVTGGIDFALDLGGAITGTLSRATGTGSICIDLEPVPPATQRRWRCVESGSTYRFGGLATGSYTLGFNAGYATDALIPEFYDDAATAAAATPVAVVAGSITSGIDAVLASPPAFTGTVTRGDGGSPLGISVAATSVATSITTTVTAVTSAGAYRLVVPAGTYRLTFFGSGLLTEYWQDTTNFWDSTHVTIGAADVVLDAVLDVPSTVSGTVVDSTGAPVAGVRMIAERTTAPLFGVIAETNAAGQFSTTLMGLGSYSVSVDDNRFRGTPLEVAFDVTAPGSTHVANFTAERRPVLSGRVVDESGNPIAGVLVRASLPSGEYAGLVATTTDGNGDYSIPIEAGSWVVSASDPVGNYAKEFWADQYAFSTASIVSVSASGATVDFTLGLGGAISGTVRDAATGNPLAGAVVIAFRDSVGATSGVAVSDVGGHYRIAGLRAGDYVVESLKYATHAVEFYDEVVFAADATPVAVVAGGDRAGTDFTLSSQGSISGTIRDVGGDPLAASVLLYRQYPGGYSATRVVQSDAAGDYRFTGVEGGEYLVSASASGFAPEFYGGSLIAADATPVTMVGADVSAIDIELDPADTGTLSGSVTDVDTGEAITDACIDAYANGFPTVRSCTDSSGAYHFDLAADRSYRLQFDGNGLYVDRTLADLVTVGVGDAQVLGITGELGGAISVTATDEQTGVLLPSVCASAYGADGSGYGYQCSSTNGISRIDAIPAATYAVLVQNSGGRYVTEWFDDASIQADATLVTVERGVVTEIDADLLLGGSLSGTVTDAASGAPLPGACAFVRDGAGVLLASGCANTVGHYVLNGIRPGTGIVTVSATGRVSEQSTQTFVSGVDVHLDVDLATEVPPTAAIAGLVASTDGEPLADICVYIYLGYDADYTGSAFCTAADGAFAFDGLAPGAYWIAAADGQARFDTVWREVSLVAGANPVTIAMSGPAAITGLVTEPDGTSISGVCALLYGVDDSYLGGYSCTGSDGRYSLDVSALAPAAHVVKLFDPQGRWSTATSGWLYSGTGFPVTSDLVMTPAASVAGRVTNAITGDGVATACIYLYDSSGTPAGFATCTRPDGHYTLGGVPDGSYVVGIADSTADLSTYWSGDAAGPETAAIVTVSGSTVAIVDAPMHPLTGLRATVSSAGAPLEGVCLYLFEPDQVTYTGLGTCSGPDGRLGMYTPPGIYAAALFDPNGEHVTTWVDGGLEVTDAMVSVGDIDMVGIGAVAGLVVDSDGNPVGGVEVYLDRPDGSYSGLYGITAADGAYVISGVPAGDYTAGFYPPGMGTPTTIWSGGAADEASAAVFTVAAGATTPSIDAVVPGG